MFSLILIRTPYSDFPNYMLLNLEYFLVYRKFFAFIGICCSSSIFPSKISFSAALLPAESVSCSPHHKNIYFVNVIQISPAFFRNQGTLDDIRSAIGKCHLHRTKKEIGIYLSVSVFNIPSIDYGQHFPNLLTTGFT